MSFLKSEDSKKWINSFVAICAALVCFIVIKFLGQMSEWFDLEAKVSNFTMLTQGVGLVVAVGTFLAIVKNGKAYGHMEEVYAELVKVVWPDKDQIFKTTIGLLVALAIVSGFFVGIDFSFQKILELIY